MLSKIKNQNATARLLLQVSVNSSSFDCSSVNPSRMKTAALSVGPLERQARTWTKRRAQSDSMAAPARDLGLSDLLRPALIQINTPREMQRSANDREPPVLGAVSTATTHWFPTRYFAENVACHAQRERRRRFKQMGPCCQPRNPPWHACLETAAIGLTAVPVLQVLSAFEQQPDWRNGPGGSGGDGGGGGETAAHHAHVKAAARMDARFV